MKKLLSIILVLTLTLIMSGCGEENDTIVTPINSYEKCIDTNSMWEVVPDIICYDENDFEYEYNYETYKQILIQEEDNIYYTQEEVDEMLEDYALIYNIEMAQKLLGEYLDDVLINNYLLIEVYEIELDELLDYIGELYDKIEALETDTPIVYTNCDMEDIFIFFFDGFEDITNGEIEGTYDLKYDDNGNPIVYYIVNGQVADYYTLNEFHNEFCVVENPE